VAIVLIVAPLWWSVMDSGGGSLRLSDCVSSRALSAACVVGLDVGAGAFPAHRAEVAVDEMRDRCPDLLKSARRDHCTVADLAGVSIGCVAVGLIGLRV